MNLTKLYPAAFLLVSFGAYAFPQVGSKAAFTTSGSISGAPFSATSRTEEVASIDEATGQFVLRTKWLDNKAILRDGSDKLKISDVNTRYRLASVCTMDSVQALNAENIATGKPLTKIIWAQSENIETIFGNIKSCKVITEETDGSEFSVWFIERAFGVAKISNSTLSTLSTTLTSYVE